MNVGESAAPGDWRGKRSNFGLIGGCVAGVVHGVIMIFFGLVFVSVIFVSVVFVGVVFVILRHHRLGGVFGHIHNRFDSVMCGVQRGLKGVFNVVEHGFWRVRHGNSPVAGANMALGCNTAIAQQVRDQRVTVGPRFGNGFKGRMGHE